MVKNMGKVDRGIRLVVGVVLAVLVLVGAFSGAGAVILGIVAVAMLATSLLGTCPVYMLLKLNTNKEAGK